MANAWGASWGDAWGVSWGTTPVPSAGGVITGGSFSRGRWRALKREIDAKRKKKREEDEALEAAVVGEREVLPPQIERVEAAEKAAEQARGKEVQDRRADLERAISERIAEMLRADRARQEYDQLADATRQVAARQQAIAHQAAREMALRKAANDAAAHYVTRRLLPGDPSAMEGFAHLAPAQMARLINMAAHSQAEHARRLYEEEEEAAAALLLL